MSENKPDDSPEWWQDVLVASGEIYRDMLERVRLETGSGENDSIPGAALIKRSYALINVACALFACSEVDSTMEDIQKLAQEASHATVDAMIAFFDNRSKPF